MSNKGNIDTFFIDGRLNNVDIDKISSLKTVDAIFILDDFDGVEKGVLNAVLLRQAFTDLVLVRPRSNLNGFEPCSMSTGNLALLFPSSLISLSRQQDAPLVCS